MLQFQAAALLVAVVGDGHLWLQPDRQLCAGYIQETRNYQNNKEHNTNLTVLISLVIRRCWDLGEGSWGGGDGWVEPPWVSHLSLKALSSQLIEGPFIATRNQVYWGFLQINKVTGGGGLKPQQLNDPHRSTDETNRTEQNLEKQTSHLLNDFSSLPLQFLWAHIQEQTQLSGNFSVYNGGVEAVSNLMGG